MKTQEHIVSYRIAILVANRLSRLLGNIVKWASYPFHALFADTRFTIPEYRGDYSLPKLQIAEIPKIIWQTNYSNRVTLPVYCNYLVNRFLSRGYEYRYISTEERSRFLQQYADAETFQAYSQLTDGAAQADFWRVFVLEKFGGVYLDIDAQLICPLSLAIAPNDREILIYRKTEFTNYFIATQPNNPLLRETLRVIVDNIQQRKIHLGVFNMTGPGALVVAMERSPDTLNIRNARYICLQGTFMNEYFQYMDKKNGKWIHTKNEDLLK